MRVWLALWLSCQMLAGTPLQVHFEERHSGSFFHFAQNLKLHQSYTLVLIDAHSDASCVADSDAIRREIREVANREERGKRLSAWRESGRVQVYDWVEPLMPKPIERVIWVGGEGRLNEVHAQIDRRAREREAGSLGRRWSIANSEEWPELVKPAEQVVVSLDLDYFAGWERERARDGLDKMWAQILALPTLRGVSIALSRPWLQDDAEAQFLSERVLSLVLASPQVVLDWEPFAPLAEDRSEESRRRLALGERMPTFDLLTLSAATIDQILAARHRISVSYGSDRWERTLAQWETERGGWWLGAEGRQKDLDERIRVAKSKLPNLRVKNRFGIPVGSVRWFRTEATGDAFNVLPEVQLGKQFADGAHWLGWQSREFATSEGGVLTSGYLKAELEAQDGVGALRIWAEATTEEGVFRTSPMELRVYEKSGFRAGLREQFGLPYIFGVGILRCGSESGPELGWGNDCANLLVWAWQRDGFSLPWCNPGQIRSHLQALGPLTDQIVLTEELLDRGVMLDRGSHVAAIWEDLAPIGILSENDVLIHQLGGRAEQITVAEFAQDRPERVMVWKRPEAVLQDVPAFGGDVNLDGVSKEIALATLRKRSGQGGLIANLECLLTTEPEQEGGYRFRASPKWARDLAEAGVVGLALANNHALDCGESGLLKTLSVLKEAKIQTTGAGETLTEALAPIRINSAPNQQPLAVFAVNLVNTESVELLPNRAGVLTLPRHGEELVKAIRLERASGNRVAVMVHWGREFTLEITGEQRHWARWLVEAGADRVVGSHPHVVQKTEYWRGSKVEFSLGNLVFPKLRPSRVDEPD